MPFRDVIGHRRLLDLLARAVARESLPPSLILSGPDGIGKRLVAVAAAQALNCTNRGWAPDAGSSSGPIDACGTCSSCLRIARGTHPDVVIVEPGDNGNIRIEQIREVIDQAAYRPFEGTRRVVIIDEADALMPQAQNALLKTLEEPPSSSVFILVTSRPDALLPTVVSRCPKLRFRPLDAGDVAAAMMTRGRSEKEARAVAALADGSIGRALEASGGDLVEARDVAERVLAQAAATDDPRRRLDGSKDLLEGTGTGGRSAEDRQQLASHLLAMASLVRDVELLSTRAEKHVALANPDVRPALDRLSVFRGERGIRAFSAIDQALLALDKNAGVKTVADWIMLQL
jgi:DNA polymerase-3 subunit delta'